MGPILTMCHTAPHLPPHPPNSTLEKKEWHYRYFIFSQEFSELSLSLDTSDLGQGTMLK